MSNVVEFEARTSIEHQAREWLVRMDGDEPLTEAERQDLREWVQRSVLHREELKRISQFWREANVLTELAVCLEADDRRRALHTRRWAPSQAVTERPARKSPAGARPAIAVAASALLASVILAWWFLQGSDWRVNGPYRTTIGQQKLIALSDGSTIQLNTNSQVQVAYDSHSRAIRLLRGEALFSVMPDPNRPFEVYAAGSVVRAVGTAFDVHLQDSNVDVTVTNGVVDVADVVPQHATHAKRSQRNSPGSSLGQLKAGEVTRVGGGDDHIEVRHLAEPELQRKMAWQEGYLAFSGEPLSEVVEQVNRYSAVRLEIGDPQLAAVAIGGRFRVGDLEAVLDVLETNFGIQARRVDDQSIRLESERRR